MKENSPTLHWLRSGTVSSTHSNREGNRNSKSKGSRAFLVQYDSLGECFSYATHYSSCLTYTNDAKMELDAEAPRNNQFQLGNYLKRFSLERAVLCVSHLCLQAREGWEYHLLKPNPERGIWKKSKWDLNLISVNVEGQWFGVWATYEKDKGGTERLAGHSRPLYYGNWWHSQSQGKGSGNFWWTSWLVRTAWRGLRTSAAG